MEFVETCEDGKDVCLISLTIEYKLPRILATIFRYGFCHTLTRFLRQYFQDSVKGQYSFRLRFLLPNGKCCPLTQRVKALCTHTIPSDPGESCRANKGGYLHRKIESTIQRDLETFQGIAEDIHRHGGTSIADYTGEWSEESDDGDDEDEEVLQIEEDKFLEEEAGKK